MNAKYRTMNVNKLINLLIDLQIKGYGYDDIFIDNKLLKYIQIDELDNVILKS